MHPLDGQASWNTYCFTFRLAFCFH
uniref:Uncharacterized protein n=1 Tax=Anguilla anguilla TaxID=7936 RepID=A0A0E9W950_ANGAN